MRSITYTVVIILFGTSLVSPLYVQKSFNSSSSAAHSSSSHQQSSHSVSYSGQRPLRIVSHVPIVDNAASVFNLQGSSNYENRNVANSGSMTNLKYADQQLHGYEAKPNYSGYVQVPVCCYNHYYQPTNKDVVTQYASANFQGYNHNSDGTNVGSNTFNYLNLLPGPSGSVHDSRPVSKINTHDTVQEKDDNSHKFYGAAAQEKQYSKSAFSYIGSFPGPTGSIHDAYPVSSVRQPNQHAAAHVQGYNRFEHGTINSFSASSGSNDNKFPVHTVTTSNLGSNSFYATNMKPKNQASPSIHLVATQESHPNLAYAQNPFLKDEFKHVDQHRVITQTQSPYMIREERPNVHTFHSNQQTQDKQTSSKFQHNVDTAQSLSNFQNQKPFVVDTQVHSTHPSTESISVTEANYKVQGQVFSSYNKYPTKPTTEYDYKTPVSISKTSGLYSTNQHATSQEASVSSSAHLQSSENVNSLNQAVQTDLSLDKAGKFEYKPISTISYAYGEGIEVNRPKVHPSNGGIAYDQPIVTTVNLEINSQSKVGRNNTNSLNSSVSVVGSSQQQISQDSNDKRYRIENETEHDYLDQVAEVQHQINIKKPETVNLVNGHLPSLDRQITSSNDGDRAYVLALGKQTNVLSSSYLNESHDEQASKQSEAIHHTTANTEHVLTYPQSTTEKTLTADQYIVHNYGTKPQQPQGHQTNVGLQSTKTQLKHNSNVKSTDSTMDFNSQTTSLETTDHRLSHNIENTGHGKGASDLLLIQPATVLLNGEPQYNGNGKHDSNGNKNIIDVVSTTGDSLAVFHDGHLATSYQHIEHKANEEATHIANHGQTQSTVTHGHAIPHTRAQTIAPLQIDFPHVLQHPQSKTVLQSVHEESEHDSKLESSADFESQISDINQEEPNGFDHFALAGINQQNGNQDDDGGLIVIQPITSSVILTQPIISNKEQNMYTNTDTVHDVNIPDILTVTYQSGPTVSGHLYTTNSASQIMSDNSDQHTASVDGQTGRRPKDEIRSDVHNDKESYVGQRDNSQLYVQSPYLSYQFAGKTTKQENLNSRSQAKTQVSTAFEQHSNSQQQHYQPSNVLDTNTEVLLTPGYKAHTYNNGVRQIEPQISVESPQTDAQLLIVKKKNYANSQASSSSFSKSKDSAITSHANINKQENVYANTYPNVQDVGVEDGLIFWNLDAPELDTGIHTHITTEDHLNTGRIQIASLDSDDQFVQSGRPTAQSHTDIPSDVNSYNGQIDGQVTVNGAALSNSNREIEHLNGQLHNTHLFSNQAIANGGHKSLAKNTGLYGLNTYSTAGSVYLPQDDVSGLEPIQFSTAKQPQVNIVQNSYVTESTQLNNQINLHGTANIVQNNNLNTNTGLASAGQKDHYQNGHSSGLSSMPSSVSGAPIDLPVHNVNLTVSKIPSPAILNLPTDTTYTAHQVSVSSTNASQSSHAQNEHNITIQSNSANCKSQNCAGGYVYPTPPPHLAFVYHSSNSASSSNSSSSSSTSSSSYNVTNAQTKQKYV